MHSLLKLLLTSGCSSPVTLQWRRPPTRQLLALFAFPYTVTLQGTIVSRKVSHYPDVVRCHCVAIFVVLHCTAACTLYYVTSVRLSEFMHNVNAVKDYHSRLWSQRCHWLAPVTHTKLTEVHFYRAAWNADAV